jgi:hypothetical protein
MGFSFSISLNGHILSILYGCNMGAILAVVYEGNKKVVAGENNFTHHHQVQNVNVEFVCCDTMRHDAIWHQHGFSLATLCGQLRVYLLFWACRLDIYTAAVEPIHKWDPQQSPHPTCGCFNNV